MNVFILLAICFAAVSADPFGSNRIVGGSITTIESYPTIAAVLSSVDAINFRHDCGGSILNQRSILSAAHCFFWFQNPAFYRFRVGSSLSNSGGITHPVNSIIVHPNYNVLPSDSDIAILRSATAIVYSNVVQPAAIASANYYLADNQVVWAAGWGATSLGGDWPEQLHHVQVWTVNQSICRDRIGSIITDNMLCSGWLDVGGRDQCNGDSGGPLYHNGVVVGVCSFGIGCADPRFPGVNVRVSRFTSWIQANA